MATNSPTDSLQLIPSSSFAPFTESESIYNTTYTTRQWQQVHALRPVRKTVDKWREWVEVKVKISKLPRWVTTLDVYKMFKSFGQILRIDILDNRNRLDVGAFIVFSPPPKQAFWEVASLLLRCNAPGLDKTYSIEMELQDQQRSFRHRSPVNSNHSYPERIVLTAESIDFGILESETSMMVMKTISSGPQRPIRFMLNLLRREVEVNFPILSQFGPSSQRSKVESYRFRIPISKLGCLHEIPESNRHAFVIPLNASPEFYRKTRDISSTHDQMTTLWSDTRTWFRQTDIVDDYTALIGKPLTLRNDGARIDIGRWTTYRLVFGASNNGKFSQDLIRRALRDYNVTITCQEDRPINLQVRKECSVWKFLDISDEASSLKSMQVMGQDLKHLSFTVRYQLEVCLSHGYLNEHNLSEDFLRRLAELKDNLSVNLLERLADLKCRIFDPMKVFEIPTVHSSALRCLPEYCYLSRSVTVTPTTLYFSSPTVELSNRVVRKFSEYQDRFLRVKFSDELNNGGINAVDDDSHNAVFARIRRTLQNGIVLGDRKYEFLAFGNSQFREHGALFFASNTEISADEIRQWLGKVDHIKTMAKRCARLGQSLSTTRPVNAVKVTTKRIADVFTTNGDCVTDGVGKMSPFLAKMIATEFKLRDATTDPPSIFQFRMGGSKGVLAIAPDVTGTEVHIRESQDKFIAEHKGLEIIRVSQFVSATTNRQLIIVLSSLGVPDEVFRHKLQQQLTDLDEAMKDKFTAMELLQKNVDINQTTLTLAAMIQEGFMDISEPFVMSVLRLWRAWSLKYLKEKAKLFIGQGACLFGCVDEMTVLQGHWDDRQLPATASRKQKEASLPEIFLRVDMGRNGIYKVIEGVCILARNPSLHPGDIRVVRAVDIPELYHLKNVVVLPQTGDRGLANMCSGGDLDGDEYLVIWDPDLIPDVAEWNFPPMDFTAAPPKLASNDLTVNDMIEFFITYVKNDRLPTIAHAHLATADWYDLGAKDQRCYELAKLHSNAVDFPKSGVEVKIPRHLRPRKWPHFMEKKNKPAEAVYVSKKVLGQLYDLVELVDFSPEYETPFDSRIIEAYCLDESILSVAAEMKAQYDDTIKRIMAQHAISTEFEVWSVFVLSHNFEKKDFTFAEELGRVISALKEHFRRMCIQKAGGDEKIGPLVAAIYTITAKQVRAAVEKYRKKSTDVDVADLHFDVDSKVMPLMSFPWIFDRELAKIAASSGNGFEGTLSQLPVGICSNPWMQMTTETSISTIPAATASSELNEDVLTHREDKHRIETHQPVLVDQSHERMIEAGIKGSMRVAQEAYQLEKGSHIEQVTSGPSTLNTDNRRTSLDRCMIEDDDSEDSPAKVELDTGSSAFDRLARLVAHD